MITLLQTHQHDIARLCQRYDVKRLSVFGSAARGEDFSQASDLDFIVEFESLEPVEHKNAYFGLLFALENLFERPIDLVVEGVVTNAYVRASIENHQEVLYAAA